jgi:hypothetical protein
MLGRADHGFADINDINAMALNAAISGSILAEPNVCFVIRTTLIGDAAVTTARSLAASVVAGQMSAFRGKAVISLDQFLVSK